MKIRSAEFLASAPSLGACPAPSLPEIAVIGRSNVGKSSLINLLTERRALAKVSVTPGKTQLINFFVINGEWCLVDLPGYGFAQTSQQTRADFNEAVADYIEHRSNLSRLLVLIDARLPPQRIDLAFLEWLQTCDAAWSLVFTKTDKLSETTLRDNIARFLQQMPTAGELPEVLTCSARLKTGRRELLQTIAEAIGLPRRASRGSPSKSGVVPPHSTVSEQRPPGR